MDSPVDRKKSRNRRILWFVIVVIAALFALRFWMLSGKESYASISAIQETEGKPVEVVGVSKGNIESWTTLAGTVEGKFQYPIVSSNSIAVVEVLKKERDRVKPGEVLIRLEKGAPNPMLHSYDRSLAVYRDALADAERMRNLYKEGAISKQVLDKSELALSVAKTDLENARESTDLIAAHAGVVTSVLIKKGEMAPSYQPLMWIARTDSVRVTFEAGSRQAMVLKEGQKAVWKLALNGASGVGAVSDLDLAADPESHLIKGEALFPNPAGNLIPGVVVSFDVLTGDRRGILKIPVNCLMEREGSIHVFAVETREAGAPIARLRPVQIGLRTSDEVEIVSGLTEGDRVVQFGQTLLEDGNPVKIIRERGGASR